MSTFTRLHRTFLTAGLLALALPACVESPDDDLALDDEPASSFDADGDSATDADGLPAIDLDAENQNDPDVPGTLAAAPLRSQGFYSFPYEAGTTVHVTNDFYTHSPEGRIDMSGTSGGPYKVVAAAGGRVKYVEDQHSGEGCANNNYVWIAHPNGEWTKYTHMKKNSASGDADIAVGDWVNAGQFIGIESNVGCASGDHVHFEVAVPDDLSDPIQLSGGYVKGKNLIPKVCGIPGQTFVAGEDYTVPTVRPGGSEYTMHGVSDASFQGIFDAVTNCGYDLSWNDGFDRNGAATFNVVFRPAVSGMGVLSHRRLTAAELDAKIDDYVDDRGYSLVHLDAYNVGSAVRYAAIFKKGAGTPQTTTYHGVSAASHQNSFNALTAAGWRPRVVSATSVGGTRTMAAVYTFGSIGNYVVDSLQTAAQYQANYNTNTGAGRNLMYLNSYLHNGAPHYTAIWASAAPDDFAKHGQTSAGFSTWWNTLTGTGWDTKAISGVTVNGTTLYAGFWTK